MIRFPRIIRRNTSASRIFNPAAMPGEWAVTGAFRFAHRDPATIQAREIRIFRNGWLGLGSFGSASLVEVADLTEVGYEDIGRRLAAHLMAEYGLGAAPAIEAAIEELSFAANLCNHQLGTVLALDREFNDQGLIEKARVVD